PGVNPPDRLAQGALPGRITEALGVFERAFDAHIRIVARSAEPGGVERGLHGSPGRGDGAAGAGQVRTIRAGPGEACELSVRAAGAVPAVAIADALEPTLAFAAEAGRELKQFTYELSERFEEINLLYSISE